MISTSRGENKIKLFPEVPECKIYFSLKTWPLPAHALTHSTWNGPSDGFVSTTVTDIANCFSIQSRKKGRPDGKIDL